MVTQSLWFRRMMAGRCRAVCHDRTGLSKAVLPAADAPLVTGLPLRIRAGLC
jgi:hypothetical protein